MGDRFVLCSACRRHVRSEERACPFCQAPLPAPRLAGKAAAIASAGLALVSCQRAPRQPPIAAMYGGPPPGRVTTVHPVTRDAEPPAAKVDGARAVDARRPEPPAPMYGGPPPRVHHPPRAVEPPPVPPAAAYGGPPPGPDLRPIAPPDPTRPRRR